MVTMRILCLWMMLGSTGADMRQIRYLYAQAPGDEIKAAALIELLKTRDSQVPVLLGYRGATTMIMANHAANPYTKLKYFNEGKKMLEEAITREPRNMELRYLRYTIQANVPAFLGYKQQMGADRLFLQQHIDKVEDAQLRMMIRTFINKE